MKPAAIWAAHLGTNPVVQAPATTLNLRRMLESAVILNWKDVMGDTSGGLIDVEYKVASDGSLEYLRLWMCSPRGLCDLICQYSLFWKWSNAREVSFGTRYRVQSLADCLDYIIQHEALYSTKHEPAKLLLQVRAPSETQQKLAKEYVSTAFAA
jgi:hypothetical protein